MREPSDNPSRLSRREVLAATAALAVPSLAAAQQRDGLGMPGPFRGRVVEVFHPRSVLSGRVQQEPVRAMVREGMLRLTGAEDEAAAWKRLFRPGDVVGVKVCPVGKPRSISQPETLLEVFRGLHLAGIPNGDIVLFNRYEDEAIGAGFDRVVQPKMRWAYGAAKFDGIQTSIEGYDPAVFVEMERVLKGQDPKNPASRRSHLCTVVSRTVNKVVNVCVLKDHASAGITMALKNMSHGFVNNVSRSHDGHDGNWCDRFISTVVQLPEIRNKVVLHVGDALIATYDGGPGIWNKHFRTWEHRSLFFATDPVAMDRVGWKILDARRAKEGLPPVAETGLKATNPGHESFDRRQPEHVLLAGQAGLGEADLAKIRHRVVRLG